MTHARLVSEWIYDEGIEGMCAKIEKDFPAINGLGDMVQKSTSPNIYVGYIGDTGNGIFTQIKNDPNYGQGCILLEHDNEATIPTQEEFDQIRSFLLNKLTEDPPTEAQVTEAIGTTPNGRTRWHISQALIAWLKAR